jgi:hypothetical protein
VAERATLVGAVDAKGVLAAERTERQLRDDVVGAHPGPVDVVEAADDRMQPAGARGVDHGRLAEDLARGVGETRRADVFVVSGTSSAVGTGTVAAETPPA